MPNDDELIHAYRDCLCRTVGEDVIASEGFNTVPGNELWIEYLDDRVSCRLCWSVATGAIAEMPRVLDSPESALLTRLVARVLSDLDELRYRLGDLPNPKFEDEGGECLHSIHDGCSWRCERRFVSDVAEWGPDLGEYLMAQLGPCLFAVLDGEGDDIRSIDQYTVRLPWPSLNGKAAK